MRLLQQFVRCRNIHRVLPAQITLPNERELTRLSTRVGILMLIRALNLAIIEVARHLYLVASLLVWLWNRLEIVDVPSLALLFFIGDNSLHELGCQLTLNVDTFLQLNCFVGPDHLFALHVPTLIKQNGDALSFWGSIHDFVQVFLGLDPCAWVLRPIDLHLSAFAELATGLLNLMVNRIYEYQADRCHEYKHWLNLQKLGPITVWLLHVILL